MQLDVTEQFMLKQSSDMKRFMAKRKRKLLPAPPPTPEDKVWMTMIITTRDGQKFRVTRLWPAHVLSAYCRQKVGERPMNLIEKIVLQNEIDGAVAELETQDDGHDPSRMG